MLTEKTLAAQKYRPFASQLYLMMSLTAGKWNDVTVIGSRILETGCQLYEQGVESTHINF